MYHRQESIDSKEDEDWIGIAVRHYSRDYWGNEGGDCEGEPVRDVGEQGLAGWDDLGGVGPDGGDEGSSVDHHEDAHYH